MPLLVDSSATSDSEICTAILANVASDNRHYGFDRHAKQKDDLLEWIGVL